MRRDPAQDGPSAAFTPASLILLKVKWEPAGSADDRAREAADAARILKAIVPLCP